MSNGIAEPPECGRCYYCGCIGEVFDDPPHCDDCFDRWYDETEGFSPKKEFESGYDLI